jgi:hypothetical protein
VWLAAGADPKVVQRVLGHATAAMTMDLYGHMIDANLWQAAQLVGDISGTSDPPEGAFERIVALGKVRKTPRNWTFAAEPPWGIEPQAYALREARGTAPGAPPALIAALASRNALNAQSPTDSRSTTRSTTGPDFR